MRRPPDYLHRPWLVEHACTCLLCTTRLRLIERLAPARTTYFVDLDGAGVRFCPGCGQQLDQSLRTGTVMRSVETHPAVKLKGPDRAQVEVGAAFRLHHPPLRSH